jgi:hypothetical protein
MARALSQASCRSPDDERDAGLFPEEVGGHVSIAMHGGLKNKVQFMNIFLDIYF